LTISAYQSTALSFPVSQFHRVTIHHELENSPKRRHDSAVFQVDELCAEASIERFLNNLVVAEVMYRKGKPFLIPPSRQPVPIVFLSVESAFRKETFVAFAANKRNKDEPSWRASARLIGT
jgi:hypothetical protein